MAPPLGRCLLLLALVRTRARTLTIMGMSHLAVMPVTGHHLVELLPLVWVQNRLHLVEGIFVDLSDLVAALRLR